MSIKVKLKLNKTFLLISNITYINIYIYNIYIYIYIYWWARVRKGVVYSMLKSKNIGEFTKLFGTLNFSTGMHFTDKNLFMREQRRKLLNFNFEGLQIQKLKL